VLRYTLPKSARLVRNSEFRAVMADGVRASDDTLVLYMCENECGWSRVGISVGKACGGAVVRNRLKRLIREAFRQNRERIPAGFDYAVMVSPRLARRTRETRASAAAKGVKLGQIMGSFLTLAEAARRKIG
jgi:ribonuclease P protein component